MHPDFTGKEDLNHLVFPAFIKSPYGSWLAKSFPPLTSESFSQWFVTLPPDNFAIETQILVEKLNSTPAGPDQINRKYVNPFWPVDGRGFRSEGQRDCNSQLRNRG